MGKADERGLGAVAAGQAVYDRRLWRLRFSWCSACPIAGYGDADARSTDHYNNNLSANKLDVGVGTGYFLDKSRFPGMRRASR